MSENFDLGVGISDHNDVDSSLVQVRPVAPAASTIIVQSMADEDGYPRDGNLAVQLTHWSGRDDRHVWKMTEDEARALIRVLKRTLAWNAKQRKGFEAKVVREHDEFAIQ